jgi:hypothetical protein
MPAQSSDSTLSCLGNIQNGSLVYTGPQIDCLFTVTVSEVTVSGDGDQEFTLTIAQDAEPPVVDISLLDPVAGSYSYPFTIQAGIDSVVAIAISQRSGRLQYEIGSHAFRTTGVLTVV